MIFKNIPICSPKLPTTEQILPYLSKIDENRWYSNFGPLVTEFLSRTAALFGITRSQVTCASNGTMLLELCLQALGLQKGTLCVMPSWTFIATPLAAVSAGLKPLFIDVDLTSQAINPETLQNELSNLSKFGKIGAVIVVAPYGMPVDVKAWDTFTETTGIPVIIDAAAAFDTILQLPQMQVSSTPMMISLHATKVFGIGEGGLILSTNEDLINKIESLTQFGFPKGIRDATLFGTNAKISEYSAAVGLAGLDHWNDTRSAWNEISNHYKMMLDAARIKHLLSSEWIPSTCNVLLPNLADFVIKELNGSSVMVRKWWGNGCHHHTIFKNALTADLKHTEYLQTSILGLPFYIGMTFQEIKFVVEQLIECTEKSFLKNAKFNRG